MDYYYEDNAQTIVKSKLPEDSLSMSLSLSTGGSYYSKIETDRSGALMATAESIPEDYSSFTVGDGNIYLQPSSGIFPKLNMDTLNQFLLKYPNIQINRMEIAIETSQNADYFSNVASLRYMYIDGADGSKINVKGITSNAIGQTAIMTDAAYNTSGGAEYLTSFLDETSLTYSSVPTVFAKLVESEILTVDHLLLLPSDITTPDFSIFDQETGFRIKLYYTLPE